MANPRPCERQCRTCRQWKHHSRFRSQTRRHGSVSTTTFRPDCRDCETKGRNERKNEDRARTIIERRAKDWATKCGVSFQFMWVNMNWRALVPVFRALMSDEGLCLSCGHPFDNERDVQIEHHVPPRHRQDWARHHARNLGVLCGSCNPTKGSKPLEQWLDEQEQARLSNETMPRPVAVLPFAQSTIFDVLDE